MAGLKSFLFFNNLSQQEVADYLGISKSYMSKLVSGVMKLRPEHLSQLVSNDKGWNTEFLTDSTWDNLESGKNKIASQQENAGIPLIPLEAIAGPGTPVYEDEKEFEYYSVPAFRDSDFLIRVKGDSMTPKFTGGDLVACKKIDIKSAYFIQWNRVYVVYTQSQGVMIKRIQPSESEDCIKCVSDNEKYAPFDVPKSDIVALALVNGSISLE